MQLYHFMFGSGMEILTCMFGLEATCWEFGRKITEIFKLLGKHVNTEGVNSIVVGTSWLLGLCDIAWHGSRKILL